jgi:hypothetical protein
MSTACVLALSRFYNDKFPLHHFPIFHLQGIFVTFDPSPSAKRPYFSSGWNRLDFVIVAVSLLEFIPGMYTAGVWQAKATAHYPVHN